MVGIGVGNVARTATSLLRATSRRMFEQRFSNKISGVIESSGGE